MGRLVSAARFLIIVAILSILVAVATLMVFGAVDMALVIQKLVLQGDFSTRTAKLLLVDFIEIVDVFLVGTVLYITAIGLYELFIDDTVAVPPWLEIHHLDDLKDKLVSVVVVVLGVGFLGQFISWDGQRNLLVSGGSAALLIVALTYFLAQKPRKTRPVKNETAP